MEQEVKSKEEEKQAFLVTVIQIGICIVYILAMILGEVRKNQKTADKIKNVEIKEAKKYAKVKYKARIQRIRQQARIGKRTTEVVKDMINRIRTNRNK